MKLSKCLNCGCEYNVDFEDVWVCPKCDALHQTTMKLGQIEVITEDESCFWKKLIFGYYKTYSEKI